MGTSSSCPVQKTDGVETVSLFEAWGQQQGDASGGKAARKVHFISLTLMMKTYKLCVL